MGDVNPYGQTQQYTPRSTDIVDAVAESKRVVDAALRSNPLRNAKIDDGLMQWRGNYAGGVSNSGTYLWIGEFYPLDNVMNKPQRGFLLSRDDPSHARVLWMYDPYANQTNPVNTPLRQLMSMHDADDNPIMRESRTGGLAFPHGRAPLLPMEQQFVDVGGGDFLPLANATVATGSGEVTRLYSGSGSMTGHKVFVHGWSTNTGGIAYGIHCVVTFSGGFAYTSPRQDYSGAVNWSFDFDFKPNDVVGQEFTVDIFGSGIGGGMGTNGWIYIFPEGAKSYSPG